MILSKTTTLVSPPPPIPDGGYSHLAFLLLNGPSSYTLFFSHRPQTKVLVFDFLSLAAKKK